MYTIINSLLKDLYLISPNKPSKTSRLSLPWRTPPDRSPASRFPYPELTRSDGPSCPSHHPLPLPLPNPSPQPPFVMPLVATPSLGILLSISSGNPNIPLSSSLLEFLLIFLFVHIIGDECTNFGGLGFLNSVKITIVLFLISYSFT